MTFSYLSDPDRDGMDGNRYLNGCVKKCVKRTFFFSVLKIVASIGLAMAECRWKWGGETSHLVGMRLNH